VPGICVLFHPQGTTNYDVFRMNVVADAAVNSLLAQRIEQGIGRGTRGGADYCVIMLVGSKLVGWIGRKKNLDFLTASTRVQLKLGQEVSKAVKAPNEVGENDDNPLYKKDHAQLLEAEHWFKQAYPGRDAVRVSALPEAVADEKATPAGSFAFRLDEVTKVVSAVRGVLVELVGAAGGHDALRERCEAALVKAKLKPAIIRDTFMKPFGKAKLRAK